MIYSRLVLQAFRKALEFKDYGTLGHCDRLRFYMENVGKRIGMKEKELQDIALLAQFHDLGKILIPDTVLFKTGPLSTDEQELMQSHCYKGAKIAASVTELSHLTAYIYHHHERWDGKGYPGGLSGEGIPLYCRLLSVVDSFDAMTNSRPYQSPRTHIEAIRELRINSGTQFDPHIVRTFLQHLIGIPGQNNFLVKAIEGGYCG